MKVEFSDERIIPAGGLAVVGAILSKSDFVKRCNRMDVSPNRSQHQIKKDGASRTHKGYDGYTPINVLYRDGRVSD